MEGFGKRAVHPFYPYHPYLFGPEAPNAGSTSWGKPILSPYHPKKMLQQKGELRGAAEVVSWLKPKKRSRTART